MVFRQFGSHSETVLRRLQMGPAICLLVVQGQCSTKLWTPGSGSQDSASPRYDMYIQTAAKTYQIFIRLTSQIYPCSQQVNRFQPLNRGVIIILPSRLASQPSPGQPFVRRSLRGFHPTVSKENSRSPVVYQDGDIFRAVLVGVAAGIKHKYQYRNS